MIRVTNLFLALCLTGVLGVSACSAQESADQVAKAADTALQTAAKTADDAAQQVESTAKKVHQMTREEAAKMAADMAQVEQDADQGGSKDPASASAAVSAPDLAQRAAIIAKGDRTFKPGKDYELLSPAKRTSSPPEKVELTEVFMYSCPHCFSFEPFIESVLKDKPPQVNFVRLPAIFNPVARLHAQAFYAARSMGVWEKLHTPMFREIHGNRNLMPNEDKLLDFVASQGVDRDAFKKALSSFEVDSKVRDALDLNGAYGISSVPTIVVNGKYVTSGSLAGSTARLREIVDYLVAKESAAL